MTAQPSILSYVEGCGQTWSDVSSQPRASTRLSMLPMFRDFGSVHSDELDLAEIPKHRNSPAKKVAETLKIPIDILRQSGYTTGVIRLLSERRT
ncbi:MAG: hypothetical protein A2Z18_03645 [Armatimonadetes bacterium RBG_16_58_9]|nr:MAG: hypothetical protein A2Z18_03645 [Armatimonadetes bacterium RBG_16_58_9]